MYSNIILSVWVGYIYIIALTLIPVIKVWASNLNYTNENKLHNVISSRLQTKDKDKKSKVKSRLMNAI